MFADAGVVSLFHRGRRPDVIVITITGGDTGHANVQEETAATGGRRILLAAHPPRNEDGGREGFFFTSAWREGPGRRAVSFQACRKMSSLRRCRRRRRSTTG